MIGHAPKNQRIIVVAPKVIFTRNGEGGLFGARSDNIQNQSRTGNNELKPDIYVATQRKNSLARFLGEKRAKEFSAK